MPGQVRTGVERLLRPETIAVIGGGTWCANVIEQCRKIGFSGEIWPVHPKHERVCGVPAYQGIEHLPSPPDAVFIGINRDHTVEAVRALSRQGAGGAVCFASGFREAQAETTDGTSKQEELLEAAGEMTILGPNCYGFLNYLDGVALWPDQHGGVSVESGVALITQSSNIAINLTMQHRGLPIAYVVTVGNQAQTGLSEIASALLQDPRVTAIGLHIEGIDDLKAFEAMAQMAQSLGKPVVALKIGKSNQARDATISHTASLAGGDAGARALLERLGIGRVSSLAGLLETMKLLHVAGPLSSNRIASLSCSGGEASLIADMAHDSELQFPPLKPHQKTELRKALGPRVALANPLDYHTYIWGDADALTNTFTAMMRADLAIGCVVLDFPRADRCETTAWEPVIAAVVRTMASSGRPMAILASLEETLPEATAIRLIEMGIVPFAGMETAIEAMEVAARLGTYRMPAACALPLPEFGTVRTMTEFKAKATLSAEGLNIPRSARKDSAVAAAEAAASMGFPVVLKAEGVAHKTDVGAVALDLRNGEAVLAAAGAMAAESYLIEEMITDSVAELLVGVVADPAHGYVLTLAAGGILTELFEDSVSLLVPATRDEVRMALGKLRIAKVLYGYRGKPAANIEAILDAVMSVQAYIAHALPHEVEINPLMCGPDKAIVVDALVRTGD